MSKTAMHTQGPWRLSTIGRRTDGSLAVMAPRSDVEALFPVAYINRTVAVRRGKAQDATDEVQEANAHLTAAGPDLLAALRLLVGMVRASASSYTSHPDFKRAEAAIAKAEGK